MNNETYLDKRINLEIKISHLSRHLRLYSRLEKEGFNRKEMIKKIILKIKRIEKNIEKLDNKMMIEERKGELE